MGAFYFFPPFFFHLHDLKRLGYLLFQYFWDFVKMKFKLTCSSQNIRVQLFKAWLVLRVNPGLAKIRLWATGPRTTHNPLIWDKCMLIIISKECFLCRSYSEPFLQGHGFGWWHDAVYCLWFYSGEDYLSSVNMGCISLLTCTQIRSKHKCQCKNKLLLKS